MVWTQQQSLPQYHPRNVIQRFNSTSTLTGTQQQTNHATQHPSAPQCSPPLWSMQQIKQAAHHHVFYKPLEWAEDSPIDKALQQNGMNAIQGLF